MKKIFKNITNLGILLLGISITLLSCQKDDSIINANENVETLGNGYSISIINKEEVFQNKIIADKISPILKTKTTINSNKVTNDEHGFTIHTDNVTYIEKGAYHSYTFYVERSNESNILENLLLTLKDDGSYKPLLVQYSNENSEQSIDNNTTVNFIELEDNFDYNSLLTMSRDCYIISVKHQGANDGETYIDLNDCLQYNSGGCNALVTWGGDCAQQEHDNSFVDENPSPGGGTTTVDDPNPDFGVDTSNPTDTSNTDTSDPFSGISGTNTGSDGTSSTSGDETVDNNNNNNDVISDNDDCFTNTFGDCSDVVTSPVMLPKPDPNLRKLKTLTDYSDIKLKISDFITRVPGDGAEDGAQYDLISASLEPLAFQEVPPTSTTHNNTHFPDIRSNTSLSLHMHPKNSIYPDGSVRQNVPVFSVGDIDGYLQDVHENNNDDYTEMLVSDAGVFAMKVTDPVRADFINEKFNRKKFKSQFDEEYKDEIIKLPFNTPKDEIVKAFVQFINNFQFENENGIQIGLGITLYQATLDSNNNVTGWSIAN